MATSVEASVEVTVVFHEEGSHNCVHLVSIPSVDDGNYDLSVGEMKTLCFEALTALLAADTTGSTAHEAAISTRRGRHKR